MKKLLVGFLYLSFIFLAGCSEADDAGIKTSGDYESGELSEESGKIVDSFYDALTTYSSIDSTSGVEVTSGDTGVVVEYREVTVGGEVLYSQEVTPHPGQLTASEWSDLENYDFYLSLFESTQELPSGLFGEFYNKGYVDALSMINVHFHNGEENIMGAKVELFNSNDEVIYTAITDIFGNAYLFPSAGEFESVSKVEIRYEDQFISHEYSYSAESNLIDFNVVTANTHEDIIEIMFVIDTTGSMGDEITYLKAEVDSVISEVSSLNPNSTIKLALLFYRDQGDNYVTRYFDFTEDISAQKQALSNQTAQGGGNFPEAVATALDEAVNKSWSNANSTKLIFHVLDAPPHDNQESMSKFSNALEIASEKGIRIIPIASSGIDKYTEYLLRNEAMLTGGTYVFITNHSGIGGDHIEATVGETDVELLNTLLVRLITEYHTGEKWEIVPFNPDSEQ